MALYLWEDLTEEQVKTVIKETDATCVIPLGSMAKHGQHSPIGTDCFIAESIVRKAAEIESICLFPTLWMGCALNPYDHAGQINLSRPLIHEMLEEIVAEVGRNGFYRIVIANAHAENGEMLTNFMRSQSQYKKNYALYGKGVHHCDIDWIVRDMNAGEEFPTLTEEDKALLREIHDSGVPYGHADLYETSMMLALRPELVRMDRAVVDSGISTGKGDYLANNYLYSEDVNYPNGVIGPKAELANERLGQVFVDKEVDLFARALRVIKNEENMPERIAKGSEIRPYYYNPR